MKFSCVAFIVSCFTQSLLAQSVAAGFKAGFASAEYGHVLFDESKRYTVGPTIEVSLPLHLAVELDTLYRPLGFYSETGRVGYHFRLRERIRAWELPVLVKYRWGIGHVVPFGSIGYAPRIVTGTFESTSIVPPQPELGRPGSTTTSQGGVSRVLHGLVIGGGVDFNAAHVRFTPEVRYVRWNRRYLDRSDGAVHDYSNTDQIEVLFGFSFH